MLIMCLILYSAASVPVRVCFDAEATGRMWVAEVCMSLLFLCDLLLAFNTAFDVDGVWVTSRWEIAQRYFRGWFWIDGPSSVPVELLELLATTSAAEAVMADGVGGGGDGGGGTDTDALAMLRFLRMFRLIRLIRLLKVEQMVARLEEALDVNLRALKLVQLVVKLVFVSHLLGCAWYSFASRAEEAGEISWASEYLGGATLEGPLSRKYMTSVYWALMTLTTVGYGDITPVNVSNCCPHGLTSNLGSPLISLDLL